MKPTIIIAKCKSGPQEYPGWIVPDTDDLFAVDERIPADLETFEEAMWAISHIPSGFAVRYGWYTDASSRERAIAIAQAFYREWKARGWDLACADPEQLVVPYKRMTREEKNDFWARVSGIAETEKGDQ